MANEFFVTVLALVIIGVLLYAFASTRYSNFAAVADAGPTVDITIATKTGSYAGIKDLVNEFNKTYPSNSPNHIYLDGKIVRSKMSQIKNSKLSSKDVEIFAGSKSIGKYNNRESKNSLWNTDRSASKRLPEFVALMKMTQTPDPSVVKLTPGVDQKPNEYAIYVATKTVDGNIIELVKALNRRVDGMTKEIPTKSPTPLPIRFYAATVWALNPNELAVYENGVRTHASHDRYAFEFDYEFPMFPDEQVALFAEITGTLSCMSAVDVSKMYPPSEELCDENKAHCYLLRARASFPSQDCKKFTKLLREKTREYNRILEDVGTHPVTRKPMYFYSGTVEHYNGPPQIFAAIDSSTSIHQEPMRGASPAPGVNTTRNALRDSLRRYEGSNGTNPRQYV